MTPLATWLALTDRAEETLAGSFRAVAEAHAEVADVFHIAHQLAGWSDGHRERLAPALGGEAADAPADTPSGPAEAVEPRPGEQGLVHDLAGLFVLATRVQTCWTVLSQAAQALRDADLLELVRSSATETSRQLSWLDTRVKQAAPQALAADRGALR